MKQSAHKLEKDYLEHHFEMVEYEKNHPEEIDWCAFWHAKYHNTLSCMFGLPDFVVRWLMNRQEKRGIWPAEYLKKKAAP